MSDRAGQGSHEEKIVAARPGQEGDLERVLEALRGLRYGEVRAVVHDGAIVQIERLEKIRLR